MITVPRPQEISLCVFDDKALVTLGVTVQEQYSAELAPFLLQPLQNLAHSTVICLSVYFIF